ncbi:MAG: Gfo/Idh/MocA family protein [bacterium]
MRLSVIGAGYFGRIHIKKIIEGGFAELAGFYDINPDRANEIQSEFDIRSFSSVDEALRFCDASIIATPTSTHYEIAKRCLESGKDIFVEKPLTDNSVSSYELTELAERRGLLIQVGHIERFNPAYRAACEFIRRPVFIEAHRISPFKGRGSDIAVIFDLMIHDIDLVLDLMRREPSSISAYAAPIVTTKEDIATARLVFENDGVANLTASRISLKSLRKMRVFQKNSYVSIDFEKREFEYVSTSRPAGVVSEKTKVAEDFVFYVSRPIVHHYDPISAELKHFVDCVSTRTRPIISGVEAANAIRIAEKVIEASSTWRPTSLY